MSEEDSKSLRFRLTAGSILKLTIIVILVIVLWQLSSVVLLAFAAILVAVMLRSIADPLARHTPLGPTAALVTTVLLIVMFVAAFLVLLGTQISAQLQALVTQIPDLVSSLGKQLGIADLERSIAEKLQAFITRGETVLDVAGITLTVLDAILTVAIVLIAGIYLAARPATYRRGFLLLWPGQSRPAIGEAMDASATALRHWLLGQLAAMTIVGILSGVGLALLGVPSALALGFIAAVTDFVPIVGPIFGAIPAVLLGFSVSPITALWVVGLYVLIQQIEGNLVQPLVQSSAVDLPPVVTLFALIAFGVLFGPLGILLATPLAVVAMVCVKVLYVRETLHEDVDVPGEE